MHKSVCVCKPVPVRSSACIRIGAVAAPVFILVLAVTIMCSRVTKVKEYVQSIFSSITHFAGVEDHPQHKDIMYIHWYK